jgi:NitT/TauT family transport system substrate-binding protein
MAFFFSRHGPIKRCQRGRVAQSATVQRTQSHKFLGWRTKRAEKRGMRQRPSQHPTTLATPASKYSVCQVCLKTHRSGSLREQCHVLEPLVAKPWVAYSIEKIRRDDVKLPTAEIGMDLAENVFRGYENVLRGTPMNFVAPFPIVTMLVASLATLETVDAKPLKHVTLAVGTSVLNVGYPMDTLPKTLGYWAAEGYDVDVQPVGTSLQAIQQMVAGNADFAQVNASAIIQSDVTNQLSVRALMANGVTDWTIAVPPESNIRSIADLKGKTIGVFSAVSTGVWLLDHSLREVGLTSESAGISYLPLGLGAAPVEAFRRGQVDALIYWAAAIASFGNAGLPIRQIAPAEWRAYPDYSLATMQRTVENDPDMIVAISRGVAKATIYALANPECAVKLHWQRFPATKPSGVDDATALRTDLNSINAQLASLADGFKLNGGKRWGAVDPAGFDRLQTFLRDAGLIKATIPADTYLAAIPDFYARVNDFDADKIRAAAQKCEVDE